MTRRNPNHLAHHSHTHQTSNTRTETHTQTHIHQTHTHSLHTRTHTNSLNFRELLADKVHADADSDASNHIVLHVPERHQVGDSQWGPNTVVCGRVSQHRINQLIPSASETYTHAQDRYMNRHTHTHTYVHTQVHTQVHTGAHRHTQVHAQVHTCTPVKESDFLRVVRLFEGRIFEGVVRLVEGGRAFLRGDVDPRPRFWRGVDHPLSGRTHSLEG